MAFLFFLYFLCFPEFSIMVSCFSPTFYYENFKQKSWKFPSEFLWVYHLGSVSNINTCFITYIFSYVSFYPSICFDAFRYKLQASVSFPLSTSVCILLPEFSMVYSFSFEVKFTYSEGHHSLHSD